jgi:flagellin-like protein
MNKTTFRMKGSKKAVTPVIATIILIAGTLVLALVVGAYTFGLFGSNVKTVTLTSGNLFAGGISTAPTGAACESVSGEAYITVALNDPGAATSMNSFTLTGSSLSGSVPGVYYDVSGTCTSISTTPPSLNAGAVTPLTLYFFKGTGSATSLTSGQTYNYVINFANGQSVSGSLIAQ